MKAEIRDCLRRSASERIDCLRTGGFGDVAEFEARWVIVPGKVVTFA